ncbi:MAG: energy-coupling factor ABC transporter ATP-binding protein [Magnetococcales bacterium]|nr:energy-coupling factor ABC transporter ATP-binding protein [Magnetococcales bacterium]
MLPLITLQRVSLPQRRLRDPIDFVLYPRGYNAIVGAEASGKSSLLRVMAGVLTPHSGSVSFNPPQPTTAGWLGVLFQDAGHRFLAARLWEEVALTPSSQGLTMAEVSCRVEEALTLVGLSELCAQAEHYPLQQLSMSQTQRVALAAILAAHPAVVLADEPGCHLAPDAEEELAQLFRHINQQWHTAVVIFTNSLERAKRFTGAILRLESGLAVAEIGRKGTGEGSWH